LRFLRWGRGRYRCRPGAALFSDGKPSLGKEPGKTLANRTSAGDENEQGKVRVRRHLRQ
jgi:hypothetical protein